jgi:hypothetical protein
MMKFRLFRYWNRWVSVGGIFLAMLLCGIGAFIFWVTSPPADSSAIPTAALTIFPMTTLTPTGTPLPTPTVTPENTVETGGIKVGDYVQITGTNGAGLRIRSAAGLNAAINFYGMDSEVFLVKDGPEQVDGFTWWFLVAPYDENRNGWAAADYLSLINDQS